MKLRKINKQVWLTEVELDGYNVRGAVICGDKKVVVLDTLSHPRDMETLSTLIQGRALIIVYTHADWDHIWGTGGLIWEDARIIAHTACLERFNTDVPVTLHEKQLVEPARWNGVQLVPPNETFQDEFCLDLGSLTLRFYHLPGHTQDSIVVFLEQYGILFMGDTVETPFPCLEKQSPLFRWITRLQRWESDPGVKTVIPAHGDMGGRKIIQRNIAYLQDLSAGKDPGVFEPMTQFYRETHGANLGFALNASKSDAFKLDASKKNNP
ncbi:MAG: MBL fold metallo-hydrolase [Desulfobacteraceae bacterium]|nr:MBL fold metallo-hydrolase [Desulfobacteraceae bacterium]